jgi:hypothetical protein
MFNRTVLHLNYLITMTTFTPVSYIFKEKLMESISSGRIGKIFYFNPQDAFDCAEGKVVALHEISGEGVFVTIEPHIQIRIDRIITLFGGPGPAYDEYDRFANACMECDYGI